MRNYLKKLLLVGGLCIAAVFFANHLGIFHWNASSKKANRPIAVKKNAAKDHTSSLSALNYPLALQSKINTITVKESTYIKDPFKTSERIVIDTSKLVLELIYTSPEGNRAVINGVPLQEHDWVGDLILEKITANAVQLRHSSGEQTVIQF